MTPTLTKNDKAYKKNKKNKKPKIDIHQNIIRQITNLLNSNFNLNKCKGFYYCYIHFYIMSLIWFITFFTTSTTILTIILIIISLDAFSIICLHECPLTIMEKKYLGISDCEIKDEFLKNIGIMYKCDHTYEKQIEFLINICVMIVAKLSSILFLKMFDVSRIYI